MASEDDFSIPPFQKPVSQRDSFSDDSADYNRVDIPASPSSGYGGPYNGSLPSKKTSDDEDGGDDGGGVTPEDHQRRVPNVPLTVPVSKKNRIVPRYEMEGTPAPAANTDSTASGNTGGGGGGVDPTTLVMIQTIQSQIDGFNIVCNEDGTLSWSFGGEEE